MPGEPVTTLRIDESELPPLTPDEVNKFFERPQDYSNDPIKENEYWFLREKAGERREEEARKAEDVAWSALEASIGQGTITSPRESEAFLQHLDELTDVTLPFVEGSQNNTGEPYWVSLYREKDPETTRRIRLQIIQTARLRAASAQNDADVGRYTNLKEALIQHWKDSIEEPEKQLL